jgi:hypothetical protein
MDIAPSTFLPPKAVCLTRKKQLPHQLLAGCNVLLHASLRVVLRCLLRVGKHEVRSTACSTYNCGVMHLLLATDRQRPLALNMFRASERNDYPLAIASVHAYLETKQLRVQSIDHVNTGLDCWYHTVCIGVAGEPADSLRALINIAMGSCGMQPVVALKHTTPNQMRNAATSTVTWLLNTNSQGYGGTKESLRNHIDVEARIYLGPRGSNRVQEDATFKQGSVLKEPCLQLVQYVSCCT